MTLRETKNIGDAVAQAIAATEQRIRDENDDRPLRDTVADAVAATEQRDRDQMDLRRYGYVRDKNR